MIPIVLSVGSVLVSYRALGFPNHPYQWVLAAMSIGLGYHRGYFRKPSRPLEWFVAILNTCSLAIILKLVIGSGVRQPFYWLQYPTMQNWGMAWKESAISMWQLDLTVVQMFLLLVTLIGSLFRFQPFASLTAFMLVIVSIPAFAEFNWNWVFPALAATAMAIYSQVQTGKMTVTS